MAKMTLRLILEVEADTSDWALAYGINDQGIGDDVADYILNQINQSPAADECGLSAERVWR